jgi:hypothetical protein
MHCCGFDKSYGFLFEIKIKHAFVSEGVWERREEKKRKSYWFDKKIVWFNIFDNQIHSCILLHIDTVWFFKFDHHNRRRTITMHCATQVSFFCSSID